jgi:hypothetical protein
MSSAICKECGGGWEASLQPGCPGCLAEKWLTTENFIRPKHDPAELPGRSERYRSVLTHDFIARRRSYLEHAAAHGTWYYDTFYEIYVHLTPSPLGRSPGVGIPAGSTMPDHALDSLLIVEANSAREAHAFAVDGARHAAQVKAGEFEELGVCPFPTCENLPVPGRSHCVNHDTDERSGSDPPGDDSGPNPR